MKLYTKQDTEDNVMYRLYEKPNDNTKNLYAVVHEDMIIDKVTLEQREALEDGAEFEVELTFKIAMKEKAASIESESKRGAAYERR